MDRNDTRSTWRSESQQTGVCVERCEAHRVRCGLPHSARHTHHWVVLQPHQQSRIRTYPSGRPGARHGSMRVKQYKQVMDGFSVVSARSGRSVALGTVVLSVHYQQFSLTRGRPILLDERASIRSTPFGQEVRSSGMLGVKPARQGGRDTCNVARKFYIGSIQEAEGWKSARPMARSPQSGRVSTWTYSITWSAMR